MSFGKRDKLPDTKPYSRHGQPYPIPERHNDPRSETLRKSMVAKGGGDMDYAYQQQIQDQMSVQTQRSKEASKQMLYGVFANTIAALEEFERREMKERDGRSRHLPKSNITYADQRHKRNDDVRSNLETQILLFETQTRACPPEVKSSLLEDLKRKTLGWSAVRAHEHVSENHDTDRYIAKLYEILATGRTDHKVPSREGITERTMREGFQAMMHGEHSRQMLDDDFRRDKNKKAEAPDIRDSRMLDKGARRIMGAHGSSRLNESLERDVNNFMGPDLK